MAQGDFMKDILNASKALNEARKEGIIDGAKQEEQMNRMLNMHEAIISKKEEAFKWDLKSETIGKNIKRWTKGKIDDANNLKKVKKNLIKQDKSIKRMGDIEKKLSKELSKEQKIYLSNKIKQAKVEKEIADVNYKMAKKSSSKLGGVMAGVGNIASIAGNLLSPLSGIFKMALSIGTAIFKTIFPIEKAWKMFLNMQSAVGGLSADIGLTNKEYRGLMNNMPQLYNDIAGYGGKIEDIANIINEFSNNTGKNRLFSNSEVEDIVKLGYSTGLGVKGVTEMVSEFDNLGYSMKTTMKTADKGRKVAAKFNINQTKLLKTTTDVVKNLTGSAFGRSVEDLTKLAAKSQSLRFNLAESIKSFKDAFFSPEKAVEAAAKIQVLGGEMAQQFGDPFSLMYDSMNNADGMAEKLIDSAKNLAIKNKNNQFIIPPAQRQILKEQAEALGQNYDQIVNAGIEQAKTSDKLMSLSKSSGSLINFSEDDKQSLSNLITMNKGGKYEIKMPNGVSKLVSNITSEDQLKNILSTRKANESAAQERLNLSQRFAIVLDRFAIGLTPLFTNLTRFLEDEGTLKKIEDLGIAISDQMIPFIDSAFAPGGVLEKGLNFFLNDFNEFLDDSKKMMDGEGPFFTKIQNVMQSMVKFMANTILPYVQYIFGNIFTALKDLPLVGDSLNSAGQQLIGQSFRDSDGNVVGGTVAMAGGRESANKLMDQAAKSLSKSESSNNFFTRTSSGVLNLLEGTAYSIASLQGYLHGMDTEGLQKQARVSLQLSGAQMTDALTGLVSSSADDNSYEMELRDELRTTEGYNAESLSKFQHIPIEPVQDAMVYSNGRLIKGSPGDAVAFIDEMAARNTYSSNNNSTSTMTVNVSGTIEHDTPNGIKNITAKQLYDADPQMFGKYIEATMAKTEFGSANYVVDFGVSPINDI